jgi:AraC-like DNA-binding protein
MAKGASGAGETGVAGDTAALPHPQNASASSWIPATARARRIAAELRTIARFAALAEKSLRRARWRHRHCAKRCGVVTVAEARPAAGVAVESRESPLGRWTSAQWSPDAGSPLLGFVERVWYFDGTIAQSRERVFPDGTCELVVMFDEPHRDGDSAVLAPFPRVCINGFRTRPSVVVAPRGRCRVLGIRFAPRGAFALLRPHVREILDVTIDLRDALGNASEELGERCAAAALVSPWNAARNASAVVRAAERWAAERIGADRNEDSLLQLASRIADAACGPIAVDELGAALGISRSVFAQRFRDRTGLTPKRFARILRFRHALSLLAGANGIARVAAEAGYYDQAHMYRDFDEFAAMTPGAFMASKRYPSSTNLAEP